MENETAFVMKLSNIKFGSGASREVGFDMKMLGARRVMVIADPNLVNRSPVNITSGIAEGPRNVETELFDEREHRTYRSFI